MKIALTAGFPGNIEIGYRIFLIVGRCSLLLCFIFNAFLYAKEIDNISHVGDFLQGEGKMPIFFHGFVCYFSLCCSCALNIPA